MGKTMRRVDKEICIYMSIYARVACVMTVLCLLHHIWNGEGWHVLMGIELAKEGVAIKHQFYKK